MSEQALIQMLYCILTALKQHKTEAYFEKTDETIITSKLLTRSITQIVKSVTQIQEKYSKLNIFDKLTKIVNF